MLRNRANTISSSSVLPKEFKSEFAVLAIFKRSSQKKRSEKMTTENQDIKHQQEDEELEEQQEVTSARKSKKRVKQPQKFDEYSIPEDVLKRKGIELPFICDSTMGRVAKHIRCLGGDCYYEANLTSNYLLFIARRDKRIILTKNRTLVNQLGYQKQAHELRKQRIKAYREARKKEADTDRKQIDQEKHEQEMKQLEEIYREQGLDFNREDFEEFDEEEVDESNEDAELDATFPNYMYYFVKARNYREMITEIVTFFKIEFDEEKVFTTCIQCNGDIVQVPKESIKDQVYPSVYDLYQNFYRCNGCCK